MGIRNGRTKIILAFAEAMALTQRKSRGIKYVTRLIDLKPEKVESSLLLGFGLAGGVSVQFDIYLLFKSLVIVLQDFHYLWT